MSTRILDQGANGFSLQHLQGLQPTQMKSLAPGRDQMSQAMSPLMQNLMKAIAEAILRQVQSAQQGGGEPQDMPAFQNMKPQSFQMPQPTMAAPQGQQAAPGAQQPGVQQAPGTPSGAKSGVPGAPDTIPKPEDKPTDKSKTAEDYMNANNGLLGKLGNQENVKDELKARYGDWENKNRSPEERAQSAYNASRHVGCIKNKNNRDGEERPESVTGNGKMEGATKSRDIRDGTEMADLKNSLMGGRSNAEWHQQHKDGKIVVDKAKQNESTESVLKNPNLKQTNDSHVTKNGTNKDNFQWFCGEAAKKLWFIPGLSNVLKGVGDSEGGFLGVLKGAAGGVVETWKNNIKGLVEGLKKGRLSPMQMLASMYKENIKNSETAPNPVKKAADNLPI